MFRGTAQGLGDDAERLRRFPSLAAIATQGMPGTRGRLDLRRCPELQLGAPRRRAGHLVQPSGSRAVHRGSGRTACACTYAVANRLPYGWPRSSSAARHKPPMANAPPSIRPKTHPPQSSRSPRPRPTFVPQPSIRPRAGGQKRRQQHSAARTYTACNSRGLESPTRGRWAWRRNGGWERRLPELEAARLARTHPARSGQESQAAGQASLVLGAARATVCPIPSASDSFDPGPARPLNPIPPVTAGASRRWGDRGAVGLGSARREAVRQHGPP